MYEAKKEKGYLVNTLI